MGKGGKGKGGIRQQLGLKAKVKKSSPQATWLTSMYARGKLSASEVGSGAAAAASSSDNPCDLVTDLARAAPTRKKKGTKHSADILKRTIASTSHPSKIRLYEPYLADGYVWNRELSCREIQPVAILPPHETLDAVIAAGDEDRWSKLGPGQEGFRAELLSWSNRVHTDLNQAVHWLCLALWGDSAEMAKRNSIFLLCFCLLSGAVRRRFWIYTIAKRSLCDCGCAGKCSFETPWAVVAWSMRALLIGRWPQRDHTGEKFPAGSWRAKKAGQPLRFRAAMLYKCGDWSWMKSALNLRGWRGDKHNGMRMCWLCEAGFRNEHNCYDFSLGASWRQAMVQMSEVAEEIRAAQFPSGIWSIPGLSIKSMMVDWMHCCCLGVLAYASGNVLYELFKQCGGVLTTKHKPACTMLENMMKAMAKELKVDPPFHSLTIGMIRSKGTKGPKLRLTATEGRHFLPVLLRMLERCFGLEDERNRMMYNCLQHLQDCYAQLSDWKSDGISTRLLATAARKHLILYAELGHGRADMYSWRCFPKHHMFIHAAENRRTNPACDWNYGDETEIGLAADIAAKCNPTKLHVTLIPRYVLTFDMLGDC